MNHAYLRRGNIHYTCFHEFCLLAGFCTISLLVANYNNFLQRLVVNWIGVFFHFLCSSSCSFFQTFVHSFLVPFWVFYFLRVIHLINPVLWTRPGFPQSFQFSKDVLHLWSNCQNLFCNLVLGFGSPLQLCLKLRIPETPQTTELTQQSWLCSQSLKSLIFTLSEFSYDVLSDVIRSLSKVLFYLEGIFNVLITISALVWSSLTYTLSKKVCDFLMKTLLLVTLSVPLCLHEGTIF